MYVSAKHVHLRSLCSLPVMPSDIIVRAGSMRPAWNALGKPLRAGNADHICAGLRKSE
jgi:hypothetical protein